MEFERATRGGGEDFVGGGGLGRPGRAGGREEGRERDEWREDGGSAVVEEISGVSGAPIRVLVCLQTRQKGTLRNGNQKIGFAVCFQ